ncbi:Protein of unknown function, partial [Gryllus bimaculatus]
MQKRRSGSHPQPEPPSTVIRVCNHGSATHSCCRRLRVSREAGTVVPANQMDSYRRLGKYVLLQFPEVESGATIAGKQKNMKGIIEEDSKNNNRILLLRRSDQPGDELRSTAAASSLLCASRRELLRQ